MLVFGTGSGSGLKVNFQDRVWLGFKTEAKVIFQDGSQDRISTQGSWSSLVVEIRFQNGCRNRGRVLGVGLGLGSGFWNEVGVKFRDLNLTRS